MNNIHSRATDTSSRGEEDATTHNTIKHQDTVGDEQIIMTSKAVAVQQSVGGSSEYMQHVPEPMVPGGPGATAAAVCCCCPLLYMAAAAAAGCRWEWLIGVKRLLAPVAPPPAPPPAAGGVLYRVLPPLPTG